MNLIARTDRNTFVAFVFIALLAANASARTAKSVGAFALAVNNVAVPVVPFSKAYEYARVTLSTGGGQLQIARTDGRRIEHFSISPLRLGIQGSVRGSVLSFDIARPEYLIVEIDDLPKLVIAGDPPETDVPAAHGPHVFNITERPYSADATGNRDSTAAIQRAIDACSADRSQRGIVIVPDGLFIATNLQLKSNVSLYLSPKSVLKCEGTQEAFAVQFRKESIKRDGTWFISTAAGATNIRIFGYGTIDGSGKRLLETQKLLNHVLVCQNCSHFVIDGPVLCDSGLWGTVIARSSDVVIRNTKHFNLLDMGEDDCIDVCESNNVAVDRTVAVSLDDSYSVKSWTATTDVARDWTGRVSPVNNVTFDHCLAWSRCFGFKVGAGVNQPEQNISFKNSVVYDAAHGIGISDSYGGADLSDVLFDSIDIERCTCNCLGRSWARLVIDPRSLAGSVSNVMVKNITVRDAGTMPVSLSGFDARHAFQGVHFENIKMPGRSGSAASLDDLKIGKTSNVVDVTVTP